MRRPPIADDRALIVESGGFCCQVPPNPA